MKRKTTVVNRYSNIVTKMKKLSLVLALVCIMIVLASCTIAPDAPSDGIWYCEELKLAIEFEESKASVLSYDENLSDMDLQLRDWIDGGFDIICDDAQGEVIEIYQGWRKHKSSDKFIITLYSKANPEDDFRTKTELNDKEYIFVRIESYDEINK